MQLNFEHQQSLGTGTQPQSIHTPDNFVQVLYTDNTGRITVIDAETPYGAWDNRVFSAPFVISADVAAVFLKLKYVSAASVFVVWRNAAETGEVVPYIEGAVHSLRHRLAVWAMRQNLTHWLEGGTIELRDDDPIARVSAEFGNANHHISDEIDSIISPGAELRLFFRSGDSDPYPMGRYYIDRNQMSATGSTTSVSGRNLTGKLLGDQTFDENGVFPAQLFHLFIASILDSFSVPDYWVSTGTYAVGMEFPPDMTGLAGIGEALKMVRNWQIRENMAGQIGVGFVTDARFDQPQTYVFQRNTDIFSRDIVRDDMSSYGRVCVYTPAYSDGTIAHPAVYRYQAVVSRFPLPQKKTLYVQIAQGTTTAMMNEYAAELAGLLAHGGVVETFVGPFRPQLLPGDNAFIIAGAASKMMGSITTVRHTFGKQGFMTELTVDSGGAIGRARVSDFIARISGQKVVSGEVKRLF